MDTKLKTGIPESLWEPLIKIVRKPLVRDNSTFEELTSQEQNLWSKFETDNIYQLLIGEPDTVPEFLFNWTSVSRLQFLECTTSIPAVPVPAPVPAPHLPQVPQPPQLPQPPSSSGSSSSSSPHSSPHLPLQAHGPTMSSLPH